MIVGLDVGTSVAKAVAFDEQGETVAVEARPTRLLRPAPERVEQDAGEVVACALEVLAALRSRVGGELRAIGITGQGDGLWLLDADGAPVRPAISWMDGRAGALVSGWFADGTFDALYRRTGNAPFPGAGAPLLAALEREEPATLDRAATAAHCKDVVMQRLTGLRATDLSDASNLFFDPAARERDGELLALLGLEHRAGLLPPLPPGGSLPLGALTAGAAAAAGLPAGLPVVAAPYDLPASALGAGVEAVGDGLLIAGTTLACEVVTDRLAHERGEPAGQTLCLADADADAAAGAGARATDAIAFAEAARAARAAAVRATDTASGADAAAWPAANRRWLRAMPAMTGTAALDWALSLTGETHARLGALLAASPPGAHGVRVLPLLAPAGERAPFVSPDARGRLDGIELGTTSADVVRAFCEGLACAARDCFEAAGLTGAVAVCGGGAASRAWLQLFADLVQRPLRIARGPEVGARGASLAAARALGLDVDPAAWTRSDEWVEPDPAAAEFAAARFARYRQDVADARARWSSPTRADVVAD